MSERIRSVTVCCVAAGWQLRGNYEARGQRFPVDDVPPAPLPSMHVHRVPAVWRRSPSQLAAHRAVFGKRQRLPIIDVTEAGRG